ncbi:MAG TPA: hypothetical protein VIQ05_29350 [Tardiphaga sp.]
MTEPVTPDPHPEQTAALVARVRKMMLIAGLTTALGVGALLVVIGYRLFKSEGSVVITATTATLPKGAKIQSTAVSGDRLLVTLDVAGSVEIRTYDARTLKPVGQLKFASEP